MVRWCVIAMFFIVKFALGRNHGKRMAADKGNQRQRVNVPTDESIATKQSPQVLNARCNFRSVARQCERRSLPRVTLLPFKHRAVSGRLRREMVGACRGWASCLPRCGFNAAMKNDRYEIKNARAWQLSLPEYRCCAALWCWQVGYEEIGSRLQSPSALLINTLSTPMSQYMDE